MDIEQFKSELNAKSGALPTNRFRMRVPLPEAMLALGYNQTSRSAEFWCQSVTFPGYQTMTHNIRRHTYGPNEARPFAGNFQQLQVIMIADGENEMWKMFDAWTQLVIPHDGRRGIRSVSDYTEGPVYHVSYKNDYITDLKIELLRQDDEVAESITVREAFPVNINPITFDWSDNNIYTNFNVFFEFLDWYIED